MTFVRQWKQICQKSCDRDYLHLFKNILRNIRIKKKTRKLQNLILNEISFFLFKNQCLNITKIMYNFYNL